jgi:membrane protein YdbS with pleckstrin-like domain
MKDWTWQKWIGKLLPFAVAVGAAVWQLMEAEPVWWPVVVAGLTGFVQWIIALFPPAEG